mgnify:CR=1 FL=1
MANGKTTTAPSLKKVCVIGAGVMGAGIAAQIANSGTEVLLLDIVPKDAGKDKQKRNEIATKAIEALKKQNPAPLMNTAASKRITAGNIDDNLKEAGQCDWVIEAIIENLDIKQTLFTNLERYRRKDTVVTSNTSTIPLSDLTAKMKKGQKAHFFISHFFNPPRYMPLLEFITGEETSADAVEKIRTFADYKLGKTIVDCNDRPGFIANRIGTYWLHCAVVEALEQGIDIETADAVLGKPLGFPRTGVFALMDMVGLDLMPHVLENLRSSLEKNDAFMALGEPPKFIYKLIDEGYTGRKGKGGFYRLHEGNKQALNLVEQTYANAQRPKVQAAHAGRKGGMRAVVEHDSPAGKYAWTVLSKTLAYAASLVPEVADDIATVDSAMRLGYNWKYGPFEMLDKLGTDWFAEKLKQEKRPLPMLLSIANGHSFYRIHKGQKQFLNLDGSYHDLTRPDGVILLEDIKRKTKPLAHNKSASLWDIGDGVACLEFHSKMNALNPFSMMMINKACKLIPSQGFKALVIYNEGAHFSVGANIGLLGIAAKFRIWPFVDWFLNAGQKAFMGLKYAPFPVVGAPSGVAVGGGCEVLLHCDAIEAHAETYTGLVEAGVGIIPGWGGCKEMLLRAAEKEKQTIQPLKGWVSPNFIPGGPMKPLLNVFPLIAMADVAKSAHLAKEKLFFKDTDNVVMNRDRLLASAKERALLLAKDYTPPQPATLRLPGKSGAVALNLGISDFVKKGMASEHDGKIGDTLAHVLSGGDVSHQDELSEQHVLDLERQGLIAMAKIKKSRARVFHMLKTGKPLRN